MRSSALIDSRDVRSLVQQLETRIARLEGELHECLAYFEDRCDVEDGDDGMPRPNEEMSMATSIKCALYGEGNF